jgi:hypothetical protein
MWVGSWVEGDALFLEGERRFGSRWGGVKDPWMAFMLGEARKRSAVHAAGVSWAKNAAAGEVKR